LPWIEKAGTGQWNTTPNPRPSMSLFRKALILRVLTSIKWSFSIAKNPGWIDVGLLWTRPADIKAQYRSASVLKNRRVIFNIKGNDYRLVVAVAYRLQIVYVKFVATHKEYDAVDAETVEMA